MVEGRVWVRVSWGKRTDCLLLSPRLMIKSGVPFLPFRTSQNQYNYNLKQRYMWQKKHIHQHHSQYIIIITFLVFDFGDYNRDLQGKQSMRNSNQEGKKKRNNSICPDCKRSIAFGSIKQHIETCQQYVSTYINNVSRVIDHLTPDYLDVIARIQMDIIKEKLMMRIEERDKGKPSIQKHEKSQEIKKPKQEQIQIKQNSNASKRPNQNPQNSLSKQKEGIVKNDQKQAPKEQLYFQSTLLLDEDNVFIEQKHKQNQQTIQCVSPLCKSPVSMCDIEKFTYLDECLHSMCLFCLRDYIRKNYVKDKGELKCPKEDCRLAIPYFQVKQAMDAKVLSNLENELNSKSLDIIQCQKCHQSYQFEKGKPSDAPKKTRQGTSMTISMSKHYAQNRFQCPKCKTQQCRQCKSMPYHLGLTCGQFQQHKKKKQAKCYPRKCRYCHSVLPKGYLSQTGIKAFDDICDSDDCANQTRQACSKILGCGHPCYGYIRQKNCLPCLNEKCALLKTEEIHGENEDSYCSLCYVEVLKEAPCVMSKCGHIFHLKCLKRRLQLKWQTARIIFRFCECPLCNKWLQLPQESPLNKIIQGFKILFGKIKQKALKRLVHQKAHQDSQLKEPSSHCYKNEEKYAMTIYAYFQCFQCHEPYFGGRKSCAEAMGDPKQGEKFNPKQLICPSCCPQQTTDCTKHGKQYISFKCRFCCSVAQWFCWGNTHFCDDCHKRQINGEYISRLSKQKLPKCQGKQKCAVGGQHNGNGDQYCLGCGICRGDRMDMEDI